MSYGAEIAMEMEIDREVMNARAEQLASEGRWLMRDGTEIHVTDMSDRHIENCIRMLRRGSSPYADVFIHMFEAEQERRKHG